MSLGVAGQGEALQVQSYGSAGCAGAQGSLHTEGRVTPAHTSRGGTQVLSTLLRPSKPLEQPLPRWGTHKCPLKRDARTEEGRPRWCPGVTSGYRPSALILLQCRPLRPHRKHLNAKRTYARVKT